MVTYPKDWKNITIEDIFKVTRGLVLNTEKISKNKSTLYRYPVYSSQTLNNGLLGYYKEYLYEDAITWTTDGANAGDTNFRKGPFYCTNVCGVLLNNEGYANQCIASIINSVSRQYVSYVGNPKLMNNVVAKIQIHIPPLPEQQTISDTLSTFDEHIDNLTELIEKKKAIRDGAVDDLVTEKVRLDGFDGEWEETRLKDLAVPRNNRVNPNCRKIDVELENIVPGEGKLIGDLSIRTSSNLAFEEGDVLFGRLRPYLEKYWIADCQGVRSGETWALIATELIDPKFLYQLVRTKDFIDRANLTMGTKMPRADWKLLKQGMYSIPSLAEQQAIASILTTMDEELDDLEREREKILQIKAGAMDDLLTGKIRLV